MHPRLPWSANSRRRPSKNVTTDLSLEAAIAGAAGRIVQRARNLTVARRFAIIAGCA